MAEIRRFWVDFPGFLSTEFSSGNRYVSMSAHLRGLADGIVRGAQVTDESIIGFADATGHSSVPVGEPHLHQAFYRNPSYIFIPGQGHTGPPFGGQGLQVSERLWPRCLQA